MGLNSRGVAYSSPVQVPGTDWKYVSGSGTLNDGTNAFYITSSGTIWATGSNAKGQLGLNDRTNRSSPIQIPGDWALDDSIFASGNKISMGEAATLGAIKDDGTLWGWGGNEKGQLGQNNTTQYSSPVQVPGTTWKTMSLAGTNCQTVHCIKTDGTMWGWGDNVN